MKKKLVSRQKRSSVLAIALVMTFVINAVGCGSAEVTGKKPGAESTKIEKYALVQAEYPEAVKKVSFSDPKYAESDGWDKYEADNKAWEEVQKKQREDSDGLSEVLAEFNRTIVSETVLENSGENVVISPANLYLSLTMLAECTTGDGQKELLKLLGAGSIEEARQRAICLFDSNYVDNSEMVSVMADSIWLNKGVSVEKEQLEVLADRYYAEVFAGDPADAAYSSALRDWINLHTGGQLREGANEIELNPETVMDLVSTIYFCAKWQNPFDPEQTLKQPFYGTKAEKTVDYMYKLTMDGYYYFDHFDMISLPFSGRASMYLIRPDERFTTADIAADEQFQTLIANASANDLGGYKYSQIEMKIPKFDVSFSADEGAVMRKLGVTSVFDKNRADFSPVITGAAEQNVFLSQVKHSARVMIDEEGCTATAFTLEMLAGAAKPDGMVEFTLDHPFLFVIVSPTNAVLFAGAVNNLE